MLFITANPGGGLDLADEQRAILKAIALSTNAAKIIFHDLPAARVDDFRSVLLKKDFDVIHFSGHSDASSLFFQGEGGDADQVSMDAFGQALAPYPIKCVVLNACSSIANLSAPISPITIGMDAAIADEAAVEFSRGFYDALANGKNLVRAFDEGKTALTLKGHNDSLVKMITA